MSLKGKPFTRLLIKRLRTLAAFRVMQGLCAPTLDDALTVMAAMASRKAQVVELRFFGGLSVEETAEILKISTDTVTRDWIAAKAWLYRELSREQR